MKISKQDLKKQKEILSLIESDKKLTDDDIWMIYEEFNPAIMDNITDKGVFFTPIGLAQDTAVFAPKYGHIVDVCAGIGVLSYRLKGLDYYEKNIKSLTCIELNPDFVRIGKRLLPDVNWICGNVFDQKIWNDITDNGKNKFDLMVSNPPYGKLSKNDADVKWMNYKGDLDIMAIELCFKYAKCGYYILPTGSVEFKYSGQPYFQECECKKIAALRKVNPDVKFKMFCNAIDTDFYRNDWKNTNITTEVAHICMNENEF